jgi:probable F420-dependent oxidoreductase
MFKVYATMDERTKIAEAIERAKRAEAMGYDGLLVADSVHDGLLLASAALQATKRLHVMTGVLVAFPRSPTVVAHAAWDMQDYSGGRFELGVGPQVRGNIVGRYGVPWTPPVPRMREYVNALRSIFATFQTNAPLAVEGEHYRITRMQPFFNPGPIEHPDIPIYLGAVGPLMTALAGEVADGLVTHPTNTHPRYVREVTRPRIAKGAERTKRSADDVKLLLAPLIAAGSTAAAVRSEREKQRKLLAFLYSTPAYWPSLELFGWGDRGRKLHELTREGKWSEMLALITDEILDEMVPTGTFSEVAEVLRERYRDLATAITFPLPEDPSLDAGVAKLVERLRA